MSEHLSILKLLEAERERYTLEAASIMRRLDLVRSQIHTLEDLIYRYATSEQVYSGETDLSHISSISGFLQEEGSSDVFVEEKVANNYPTHQTEAEFHTQTNMKNIKQQEETSVNFESYPQAEIESQPQNFEETATTTASQTSDGKSTPASTSQDVDISDIPKRTFPPKPGTLPMLGEYQEYTIQNAVLILMRRHPNAHMHLDAIVHSLYGNLPPQEFKTAKVNVAKAVSEGLKKGLWYRVLRTPGVYTLRFEKGVTGKSPARK
jgi:hypothetical protein